MSADRFTIDTDDGIFIQHPFAANMTVPQMFEGAIRQQARDLELLTNMLHDQRLVIDDLEHRRGKVCDENDQLRADLAAAVAERDLLGYYRSEFEPIWDGLQDALEGERQINNYGLGESEVECVRRVLRERDILRARLAAIDAAPVVAWQDVHDPSDLYWRRPDPAQVDTRELIARPAKDSP